MAAAQDVERMPNVGRQSVLQHSGGELVEIEVEAVAIDSERGQKWTAEREHSD